MKMRSLDQPFLVSVVCEDSADGVLRACQASLVEGAQVVELNLAQIPERELPNLQEACRRIPLPFYVVCRRREFMEVYGYKLESLEALGDQERSARLLRLLDNAVGLDVEMELAETQRAELIASARALGKEVILSVHTGAALSTDDTLILACRMRDFGANAIKIIHHHSDPEYPVELWRSIHRLRDKLDCPFILLSIGPGAMLLRHIAGHLGCSYCLARPSSAQHYYADHPKLTVMKQLLGLLPTAFGPRLQFPPHC